MSFAEWFPGLSPIIQTQLATLFIWLMKALGAGVMMTLDVILR